MDLEIRAFGTMEVWRGQALAQVASRRQQLLLAMLLVRRGGVVSVSALAEALWPERPPATVGKSVQIHVYRLRRMLGDAGAVQHRPPGYAVALPRASVDIYRFEDLVQRGRAALVSGDEATAVELFQQAVAVHRGPAFQGLDDVDGLAIESQRLDQLRLAALEDRIAAELVLGSQAGLVAELVALVAEHPLRERFRAQLMTALYRTGRKADALAVYRKGRQILIDELGVEPDEECQALARAILADDPSPLGIPASPRLVAARAGGPPVVPRQLPADVPAFSGRGRQLRRLAAELGGTGAEPRSTAAEPPATCFIAVVEGTAGVGKTALAVHWGHRVRDRFTDGQLYVNLRGYAAGPPLAPVQVLTGFLRALGVPVEQIPTDLDEAAAAYRSQLADRRVLVLLDNAASADQVRPLLPGGGRCAVLVTSRDRLAGLVARDGAVRVALDVLPAGEARALLARTAGADRVAAELSAARELAELCGRLPLALRIAAANLAVRRPHPIADYVTQLRGSDRLAALAVAGDEQAAVAAAFDLSYHRLPERARLVFRRLGLVPGPDVTAEAVAALAGGTAEQGRQELAALAGAHLVQEHRPDRYACHDLLRAYARERVQAEETTGARRCALSRLQDYYLRTADAATVLLYPHALRLPRAGDPGRPAEPEPGERDQPGVVPVLFPDPPEAVRWLDTELPNLVAAVRQAAAAAVAARPGAGGPGAATAWLLADVLRSYLLQRGHIADGEALAGASLVAAEAAGERLAHGGALLHRAGLRYQQGRSEAAIGDLTRALAVFRDTGWVEGQGAVLSNLGTVQSQLGRQPEAVGNYTEALAIYERIGSRFGQAGVIGNLGVVLLELGRLREAAEHARRAVTGLAGLGSDHFEALNLGTLGEVQRLLGELGPARRSYAESQARYRTVGDRTGEGSALLGLAEIHCDTGQLEPARELAGAALRIARDTEHVGHEASALAGLARFHRRYGELGQAAAAGQRALELARQTGDRHLEAEVLIGLAALPARDGPGDAGRTRVDQALGIARTAGFRLLEGLALTGSAILRLAAGDPTRAIQEGERALAIQQEIGHRLGAARTHLLLGRAHRLAGGAGAGRDHHQRAAHLLAELGVPESAAPLRW